MTLDDELIAAVDSATRELGTSRSAFTRDALHAALRRLELEKQEARHRRGYLEKPVAADEFGDWGALQDWGDE